MIESPSISVIIPTFNRAHLLPRAIKSVLDQTYGSFELIVVDDGSQDDTKAVVNAFDDPRVRYIRLDRNSGTSCVPRNVALKAARSKYVAFQDSDDEWSPVKLEKQIKIFEHAPPELGIVYSDMWRVGGTERTYLTAPSVGKQHGLIFRDALNYALIGIGIVTTLIRKECFTTAGGFDEALPTFIDAELFIRFAKHFSFHHIPEPLIKYHETKGSTSSNYASSASARKMILEKYFGSISEDPKVLANHYFGIGFALCQSQDMSAGRAYFLSAFRKQPSNPAFLPAFLSASMGPRAYKAILSAYRKIRPAFAPAPTVAGNSGRATE